MSSDIQLDSIRLLGDSIYRIEWLGDIVRTRKAGSTTQCVRVICSAWKPGDGDRSMRRRGVEPLTVRIPIALMRYLRIGDLWHHGRFVGSTTVEEREYGCIDVNTDTATPQLAGAAYRGRDGQTHHELPFDMVDGHSSCTDSWLVRLRLANGSVLLIPSLEIARFYFGRSGRLLNLLFDSAGGPQKWCRKLNRDELSGEIDMELADGVPSMAACEVARLELDPAAQRAVRAITASAIKAHVNWEPFFPRLTLPLAGQTKLRVGGMPIRSGDRDVFLVHYIASCSHPFPFTALRYHVWSAANESATAVPIREGARETLSRDDRVPHPSDSKVSEIFTDLKRKIVRRVVHTRAAA